MYHNLPSNTIDFRRRCPGTCSTSYPSAMGCRMRVFSRRRAVAMASSSSVFDLITDMERQMDREMDAAFSRARAMERQMDAEFQRALSNSGGGQRSMAFEEMRAAPNVDIQRQEERGPGTYRYYERIQISSGPSRGAYIAQPTQPAAVSAVAPVASFNPAFVGALVVVGCYLTTTAAFNRNYALTNYAESKRWLLLALWPLLFLFSPKFREQFGATIRGERVGMKRDGPAGGSSGQL